MEKNSGTEMLPGKRDFYHCCKARRRHVNKEFWQQFQNYGPPSLRVIRTKFARTIYIYIYYIPPPLTVHFSMTRSMRYQPILHTLYYTLHTEHAYCLSYRFFNNVVITTVIEMVEMVEISNGRLGKRSVERVRYVINNLLHLVIVKYGDISLVLCISTRLRLVTILSQLVKYLIILHADPCNKTYYTCQRVI